MKKADFIILSAVFGILLLLFACRKDIDFMLQGKEAPPSAVLETAKVWHLKHLDKGVRRHLTPRWDGSWTEQSTSGERLLVVPAREKRVNNKDIKIRRVFIFNASGGVVSDGRIVEFLGMKYDVDENLRFLVRNYDRSAIADFDGGVMQYDVNYRPLENATYKNGRKLESATTEIIHRTGAEFQAMIDQDPRKMMSLNITAGSCFPVTPELVGFPPIIMECYYTFNVVSTYDQDTGCLIDRLHIYVSHICPEEGGGDGSGSATASGSGSSGEDPPYAGDEGGGGTQREIGDRQPASTPLRDALDNATSFDEVLELTTPYMILDEDGILVKNPDAFNCHYYAFNQVDENHPNYDPEVPNWSDVPNVDGFHKLPVTSNIQVGDRIIYYQNINGVYAVTHSGIVTEVDSQGYATKISSKMGVYEIKEHHPRDVPSAYGPESPWITMPNSTTLPSREYWRENTNTN